MEQDEQCFCKARFFHPEEAVEEVMWGHHW
jgi:hypothetical protein